MTSANVIHYRITDASGKEVGTHRISLLCKPHWEALLKFVPWDKHAIQAHGFDTDEAPWEDEPVSLEAFLRDRRAIRIEEPLRMNVKIKNYTSNVPVGTTVSRIEGTLASAGANEIVKIYGPDAQVTALRFKLVFEGRNFTVQLPANAQACFEALWKEHTRKSKRVHPSAKERIVEQAHRTAWKLVQDWVEVQISLIVMRQAEWLQVFMAYLYDTSKGQTVYDLAKSGGFKQLPCNSETLNSGDNQPKKL